MRISLDSVKPSGEWCSFDELCGVGDGKNVVFKTPFPASEARGLLVMRDFLIVAPDGINRVLDPDGKVMRDDADGYSVAAPDPDEPAAITFERGPRLGQRISVSAIGRRPAAGTAFMVLPMTDNLARKLDEQLPPEFRKRKREDIIMLSKAQDFNRTAFQELVVGLHGFVNGKSDEPLPCDEPTKKAIMNQLGSLVLGTFVTDRANVLQRDRASGFGTDSVN